MWHDLRTLASTLSGRSLAEAVAIGVAAFALTLAGAVAVVVTWPPYHFRQGAPRGLGPDHPPVLRVLVRIGRNLAGAVLVLLGVVMALPGVPGQGILTILIGLTLLDFPGKARLERALVSRPSVLAALNRLRARFHRAPLDLD